MSKQNTHAPRSAEELLRRFDFIGIKRNIEMQKETLNKVENEINNMVSSLIINLSSVIENQSEVSLWFYNGVPTKNNKPYISWTTPSEHEGDFYYDRSSGFVYQYLNNNWNRNEDYNLVQAMALTNAELSENDHERRVFFNVPTIPYNSGDWWIKEDGTLFVCQIGKNSGTYKESDFISSSRYTATVAVQQGNEIKVLKGTVTQISENYVSITDLATGGSTMIAGENIKTGVITSVNYSPNTKGMKIDLNNGTIDTKNAKWDEFGNIILSNGAKVIDENGLMSNMKFDGISSYKDFLGFYPKESEQSIEKSQIIIESYIPNNFTVVEAKIILVHNPVSYIDYLNNNFYGYSRNIRLYKANNKDFPRVAWIGSEYYNIVNSRYLSEISGAFGNSGFTALTATAGNIKQEIKISIDIKKQISVGHNMFVIQTANTAPAFVNDMINKNAWVQTGQAKAYLHVIGKMK